MKTFKKSKNPNSNPDHFCACCGEPIFETLDEGCPVCGWIEDPRQDADPNLKPGENKDSLNEHKRWFDEKRKENPDFFAAGKRNQYHILCPVCGETILEDEGAICPTCGWEMDIVQQSDPNYKGGANALSLNQKKEWFAKERAKDPEYNWEIKEIIRPGEEMSDQEFNEQLFVFFPEAIPAAERRRVFANGCNFQIDAKITCASYFAPFLIKSVEPHNEKDLKRCCRMIYWMLVKGKRGIEVFAASIAKPLAEKNIDPLSLPLLEQSRQTISSVRKKAK